MTAVTPFLFDGEVLVRVVMIDGEPWFVAADVCKVLEIGNVSMAVGRLDDDEKGVSNTDTLGGRQEMVIINESGLYALILTSRKPAAKRFRKWVTAEVLPSIRKTGSYDAQPHDGAQLNGILDPDIERLWQGRVSLAYRVHGRSAARRLWALSPLPQVAEVMPMSMADDPDLDPEGCLSQLVDWVPTGSGATLAELLTRRDGPDVCRTLRRRGIIIEPKGWSGWIAVSNTAPELARLYAGTRWRGTWGPALLQLPGARRCPVALHFGTTTRAVLIPLSLMVGEGNCHAQ
jgi:prophage antirepressor-like protein